MERLISFKIHAEKGFLKKPDVNDGIYLTYNMLHKPAVLGIMGAIVGLKGYGKNGVLPDYYIELRDVPVGIKPINDDKGNFQKTVISYNNTTGLASDEPGGNLIITEQTLIEPAYQVFLLLDMNTKTQKDLYSNLISQTAIYLPYLGKNDYSLWWNKDEIEEYEWGRSGDLNSSFRIVSAFNKGTTTFKQSKFDNIDELSMFGTSDTQDTFVCFERLPVGFNEKLLQYEYADFVFTNFKLKNNEGIENLYCLNNTDYVQLN